MLTQPEAAGPDTPMQQQVNSTNRFTRSRLFAGCFRFCPWSVLETRTGFLAPDIAPGSLARQQ